MFVEKKFSSFEMEADNLVELCSLFAKIPGTALLYSGGSYQASKTSYLCLFPKESFWIEGKKISHLKPGKSGIVSYIAKNPWEGAEKILPHDNAFFADCPDWVGYFGYEMGAFSDREVRILYRKPSIPDAYFFRPSVILKLCHPENALSVYIREEALPEHSEEERRVLHSLSTIKGIQELLNIAKASCLKREDVRMRLFRASDDRCSYQEKIKTAKELIYSGAIYQVNLSQQFLFKGECSPFGIFKETASINPAPFMAYLQFPKFTAVSTSPERFLCKRGKSLETRPIKGTAPRGKTPALDKANKEALLGSAKERAELLMITDLMRNDMGKISLSGSVKTERIWECEAFANVFHLHSLISSESKSGLHPVELVRAAFPGGSISGCPKLRAQEVISELEGRPRGLYTGSIGYFSANGDFDFNIAIRTLVMQGDLVDVQLGGAIVADSDPEKEYEEVFHKGASLFQALGNPDVVFSTSSDQR